MINSLLETVKHFVLDINRYKFINNQNIRFNLIKQHSLWIIAQYRLSRWIKFHCKIPIIRQLLRLLCATWEKTNKILFNCEFPNIADIGAGVYLPHPYGIVIHCDVKIGTNCNIGQQVSIGVGGRGERSGVPTIGDRVLIAPGAKVFGKITIGNDVAIGANAVVIQDIPDNAVVAGIPAKIISHKGSQDFIIY